MGNPENSPADAGRREQRNLAHLGDTDIECILELGRKTIGLSEARALKTGSVVVLEKRAGQALELRLNGTTLAYGEVVVIEDRMLARITSLAATPDEAATAATALAQEHESHATYPPPPLISSDTDLRRHMIAIPGGVFTMGGGEDGPNNQRPARLVRLTAFYIAPYPVTNDDYREFVVETSHRTPRHWRKGTYPQGKSKHPVVNVSWHEATAYAEWLGARLPTEAEWEKAARGTDQRLYPWGNRFVDRGRCNCNNLIGDTLHVSEFPLGRSPYGVWDMAGNAYEWCWDYYSETYYQYSPAVDPNGPEMGPERVIRGGFFSETRFNVQTTHRNSALENHVDDNVGFRVALDVV